MSKETELSQEEIDRLLLSCIGRGDPGAVVETAELGCSPGLLDNVVLFCCNAGALGLAKRAAALREESLKEKNEKNEAIEELEGVYASRGKIKDMIRTEELRNSEVSTENIKALISFLNKK